MKVNFGMHEANLDNLDDNTDTDTTAVIMKKDWEIELEERGLWPIEWVEVITRYYDMDKIIEHIAGSNGLTKQSEFDRLLGGPGALV